MRAIIDAEVSHAESSVTVVEVHEALRELGLEPADMPDLNWEEAAEQERLREYFRERATPIFKRMPNDTEEEQARIEFAKKNIIYASELSRSSTPFMLVQHTNSWMRFRLSNSRLEELQNGCEQLVTVAKMHDPGQGKGNRQWVSKVSFAVEDRVKVYEHGHEDSTIQGQVVRSRWNYAKKQAFRELLTFGLTMTLFIIALVVSHIIRSPAGLSALADRFMTAMLAAALVAAINFYYAGWRSAPVVQWTLRYGSGR